MDLLKTFPDPSDQTRVVELLGVLSAVPEGIPRSIVLRLGATEAFRGPDSRGAMEDDLHKLHTHGWIRLSGPSSPDEGDDPLIRLLGVPKGGSGPVDPVRGAAILSKFGRQCWKEARGRLVGSRRVSTEVGRGDFEAFWGRWLVQVTVDAGEEWVAQTLLQDWYWRSYVTVVRGLDGVIGEAKVVGSVSGQGSWIVWVAEYLQSWSGRVGGESVSASDVQVQCFHDLIIGGVPDGLVGRRLGAPTLKSWVEGGYNVHAKSSLVNWDGNQTLAHLLCRSTGGDMAVAELLLKHGCDVDARDGQGLTPVGHAVLNNHVPIFYAFIKVSKLGPLQKDTVRGGTLLFGAAQGGHLELCKILVDEFKIPVDEVDSLGSTALVPAASFGRLNVVTWLLTFPQIDVDMVDRRGNRAINYAVLKGHTAVVEVLIQASAFRENLDDMVDGWLDRTILFDACQEGRLELAKLLVSKYKLSPNAVDSYGDTPLHLAAWGGHLDVTAWLLDQPGVDGNAVDSNTQTPVHWAAERGHDDILRMLLDRGCKIQSRDSHGNTPLHLAVQGGHESATVLLLDRGANPRSADDNWYTPLHRVQTGTLAMRLIDAGAEVGARSRTWTTPLHVAADAGRLDVVDVLITRGSDVNAICKSVWESGTPLHLAAWGGHVTIVKRLIAAGARLDLLNNQGELPLHRAVLGGNREVVESLLIAGSPLDWTAGKETTSGSPLHYTALPQARGNGEELAGLLIRHGASVETEGSSVLSPGTPLHWAARASKLGVARVLLEWGGDVNARDPLDRTPVYVAREARPQNLELIKLLMGHGGVRRGGGVSRGKQE